MFEKIIKTFQQLYVSEKPDVEEEIIIDPEEGDEEEDDDNDYDDFFEEDTWEDEAGMVELKARLKVPESWYFVKCVNYSSFTDVREWCDENCYGVWQKFGWSSGCASKVGVAFALAVDAAMFKLRWR